MQGSPGLEFRVHAGFWVLGSFRGFEISARSGQGLGCGIYRRALHPPVLALARALHPPVLALAKRQGIVIMGSFTKLP